MPGRTKAHLYELVKKNKEHSVYATQIIAEGVGHETLYTPPYHPELQIELMKHPIAQGPPVSMEDL
ncbi:TPA: hypothetical protein N0F65_012303, partial [Lagenidium giganteum]